MSATRYRRVLLDPRMRVLLLIGFLVRVPMFGVSVLLTIHVVERLQRSWSEAGLVAAASTLALAISGPWRGRLLDTLGLRRVVLPCIVVNAACWSIAPFVGYLPLLVLVSLAGLFAVPTFTIVRQGIIATVTDEDRRTALAVDGIMVEFAFMLGPVLAIALATVYSSAWVIFGLQMASACFAVVLWCVDPPLRVPGFEEATTRMARGEWMTPRFLSVCLVAFAAVLMLSGSDVSFVAAARDFGATEALGWVLAASALGSVLGGLVYGAMPKAPPLYLLLALLAVTTMPIALAGTMWTLAGLAFLAGMFCAPTLTASVDAVARVVPEAVRGEAMGWHGSFLTLGGALGGPVAGWAIDRAGFGGGFVVVGVVGLVLAASGYGVTLCVRRRRGPLERPVPEQAEAGAP